MNSNHKKEDGFGTLEIILAIVILVAVVFLSFYIYNARKNTNKVLDEVDSSSSTHSVKQPTTAGNTPGSQDNTVLQSDLSGVSNSNNASSQDLNNASSSLNDQSTFTTVPQ
jgi:uncharacterized protein YoxC